MDKEEIKNLLLDFTVEYDPVSWSNEKVYDKFAEIFYQKFADLEAKLAESENIDYLTLKLKHSELEKDYEKLKESCKAKINELEKQLAEKEKEIKELKFQIAVDEDWAITHRTRLTELEDEVALLEKSNISLTNDLYKLQKYVTTLQEQLEESKHKNICLIMEQNQTAIAELKKTRHYAKHIQGGLIDYIDQQIRVLKGE